MKKFSYCTVMSITLFLAMTDHSFSQGCVAIRGTVGASCMRPIDSGDSSGLLLHINNCYFKSYKHFTGAEEQYKSVDNGTEFINHTYNMDLFLVQTINSVHSVPDKIRTKKTGAYVHGDAAFADYAVNIGMAIRF